MNPGWLSFGLSCVLAVIALVSVISLLRYKAETQGIQVAKVEKDIADLKTEFTNFKTEILTKLAELNASIRLTAMEQAAATKLTAEGMVSLVRNLEKLEDRVHDLETGENGNSTT